MTSDARSAVAVCNSSHIKRSRWAVPLLAALFIAASSSPAAAQDRSRIWLGLGLGAGGARNGEEIGSFMGELVYQRKAHHVAVRGVLLSDVVSEGDESFGELGVLYGRAAKGRLGHAAIAAGLALTTTHCPSGTSEPDECSAVGIPIVAEAAFRPARVFGVGVQAFANLNRGRDFGGVVIFLQLGSMP